MVFISILLGLLPSFLMVGLGGLIRNRLSANAWQGLDRLNFEILFPALIFVAASSRPIALTDMLSIGPAVWAILLFALSLGYLARRFGPDRFRDFAGAWQTAWRFNTALGFVAVETLSPAPVGELAVAVGMAIPMANLLAVTALSRGSGDWRQTVVKVATNPFLIASVSGVLVGISGITIPVPVMAPLEMLSRAAIPVALISVGATMNWGALARLDRFSAIIVATKLIAAPAAALAACLILQPSEAVARTLVLFAALPTASAAHVLAAGFGADRELAATLVAQSTLLAAATLPLWITVIALVL
ncbi:AEC family transporter [Thalassovita aquimarina]|uniref:AEC family transporter n=1 Tax=Thalassovita aquimarina TaxID=2785917 RepID=A0ABS5HTY5_9RHOB|nr:AEC family transporter [Thalassovita aquimarina]MBR9652385.1 AEC family transporter [Thalassovita aquimarina]